MSLTMRPQQRHLSGITTSFQQQQDTQGNPKLIQDSKIASPNSSSPLSSSPLKLLKKQTEKKLDAQNILNHSVYPYNGASASSLSSRTTHQNIPTATTIHHQQSIQPASSSCQIPTSSQIMGLSQLSQQPFSARIPLNTSRPNKVFSSKIQEESDDSQQQIWCGQDTSYKVEVEQQITFEGAEDSAKEGNNMQMSREHKNSSDVAAAAARSVNNKTSSIFKPTVINENTIDESTKTQENPAFQLFFQHSPLVKLESILVNENKGDQQLSMHEDSSFLLALMQSSMWESAKINERGKGSFFKNPNTAKLTKRLLDLQEPRGNIEEEEESETEEEDLIIQASQDFTLTSKDPNTLIVQNNNTCQTCGKEDPLKETPDLSIIPFEELEQLSNVEEFSSHQKPPSMTSINNLQLNRDWSNSKQFKPLNRYSSTSVDATTARGISASEFNSNHRNSFSQQLKDKLAIPQNQQENTSLFHLESHQSNSHRKQTQGSNCKECAESNGKFHEEDTVKLEKQEETNNQIQIFDESYTASYQSESIPDEPDKKEILQTRSVLSRKIDSQKRIQNASPGFCSSSFSPRDDYFIPELLRCFSSPQDHYSNLFHQYFQKMYSNFSIPLSIENLYQRIAPVILPSIPSNKKTIFFDLDETLVHCIDIFTTPAQLASFTQSSLYFNRNNGHNFPLNTESCNETFCTIRYSSTEHIQCLISIRPYVQEMLEELAKDFELILLTAARQIYADAVLEKLDPAKKLFSHRFYRECCLEFQLPGQKNSSKNYLKDLRIFQNRRSENVILVDNSPLSFSNQINNGVPILDYCNNHKADTELKRLTLFLKSLANVHDVREHIHRKFLLNDYKAFKNIERLQEYLQTELSQHNN